MRIIVQFIVRKWYLTFYKRRVYKITFCDNHFIFGDIVTNGEDKFTYLGKGIYLKLV